MSETSSPSGAEYRAEAGSDQAKADKAQMRAAVRRDRSDGDTPERRTQQRRLGERVSALIADRPAVVAYAALAGEPNLDEPLNDFMARGGSVFLPVTSPGQPLGWGRAPGTMDLEPQGTWLIREPDEEFSASELAAHLRGLADDARAEGVPGPIALIPGLLYGSDGTRLGNGGGFYDRTFGPQGAEPRLADEVPLVGICFSGEFGRRLDTQDWDLRVNAVLTDEGLYECGGFQSDGRN